MGCQLVSILMHINPDVHPLQPHFTSKLKCIRNVMAKRFSSTTFDGLVININYYCSRNSPDESMIRESVDADAPSRETEGRGAVKHKKRIITDYKAPPPKIGETARRENADAEMLSMAAEGCEDAPYRNLISPPKNDSKVPSAEITVDLTPPSPAEETKDDKQPSKEEKSAFNPSFTPKILPPSLLKKKRVASI
ncbi:uncharacterized protein LOC127001700 isoform X1 [Eriocheir sinensis]|uniref:uncharacterized protein LOC126989780 isoform X1 n=2 Tax=Eriocheir sinensis TaxID=95602 RepID=UPI0021CA568E|nr:uncharacterized protein LOC126989780 isoform X1 [Eriocheir sinensis]XP_050707337.1 uncharacterized protein LOC126992567 isoform X1 [Eriocheir sinensis]XP_050722704.1 uncharacterized protein LOC127001700 isoform X1 [Eriocheir sinensis]